MNLPKDYISYNQIRQYQTCPKKYYFSYIEKISTPINENIFVGIIFHSAVEHFLRGKIAGIEPDRDTVIAHYNDLFSSLQAKNAVVWKTSEKLVKERGLSFIKYFIKELATTFQPLMVEKEFLKQWEQFLI